MKFNHLYISCILLLLLNINFIQAQKYVDASVSGGSLDGSSWGNAYSDLSLALADANPGDEFWVAQGTYRPTSSLDKAISFNVSVQGVDIYGGFQSGQTNLSQRDWVSYPTILSGDINMDNDTLGNSFCIFYIGQTVTTITLDGLIFQDGNANGQGGGATLSGAAINVNAYATSTGSAPIINNCTFQNNFAKGQGGAIYVEAGNGGAVFPEFDSCVFQNNKSGSSGGAIYHSGYSNGKITSTFINCDFSNNTAGASGGAVFNHGGSGNTSPIFKQCNFESNNSIGQHGGAMYNLGNNSGLSSPIIINCRFFNNSGSSAGAIYNNGTEGGTSSPTITNCTFAKNYTSSPSGNGGTLYANGQNGNSNPIITNCIFYDNTTQNTNNSEIIRSVDGTPIFSYCFVDVNSCLELQSGPNITCGAGMIYDLNSPFTNVANGDLTLSSGSSVAADQGLNSANSESIDMIGVDRVSNTTIDLGAYEFINLSALPIELVSFRTDYQQDKVKLSWVTANEINNEYFTIQHSSNGINFQDVEDINGAGNSTVIQSYFSFHHEPVRGINYYRLKQTDFDGTSSLSDIETVKVFDGKINAFPNPVIDEINISFADFEKGKIDFAIYTIYGKEILRQKVEIENGLQIINLNEVGSFLPGTYFIKIFNAPSGAYVHKFQKVVD